jgi:hypothetical protein
MMANEHRFILSDEGKPYKRQRVGDGVNLVLAKSGDNTISQSFDFDPEKYSIEAASSYVNKMGLEVKQIKAARALDGKVWSSGLHHVFVNDEPSTVYVPRSTIIETFNQMKDKIESDGSIGIGIDHLSDSILEDNEILAKMNLLDVGSVSSIVTDGQGIFIRESNITNDAIRSLHEANELPSYSIVGGMNAKPCPSGKADYVVEHIDVERIDIVGEGGCESCKVGVQPSDIILTAKLSNKEEVFMVDANEAPVEEVKETEEVVEEPVEEVAEEEVVEVVEDGMQEEEVVEEEEEEVEVEEEVDPMDVLRKEISDLKNEIKDLGGKKPKVEAKAAEKAVNELIHAGKALPKMKAGLIATYNADPEAFATLAASMPKMVQMEAKAKLAKKSKKEEEDKQKKAQDDAVKAQLEDIFRIKL